MIVSDSFTAVNSTTLTNRSPDVTNLTSSVYAKNGGNWATDIQGNRARLGADIGIGINLGLTNASQITLSNVFNLNNDTGDQTTTVQRGAGLGFFSSVGTTTHGYDNFTGLVVDRLGNVRLLTAGASTAVTTVASFNAAIDHTLAYTVNTTNGTMSNILVDGAAVSLTAPGSTFTLARTVFAGIYNSSAVSGDTAAYDNFSIATTVPPLLPPNVPAGLTAIPGNAQVALSWNTSSGATSYKVRWSTNSGAPYAFTNTVTSVGFTNTGLLNGTNYYFVVSAVGPGGESANSSQVSATPFTSIYVHPGILHTLGDLNRMKTNVAANVEPWQSGFAIFSAHSQSQSSYTLQGPFAQVDRGTTDIGITQMENDGNAAYQNALMWYITGNSANATKAIQILDAWSGTLTNITGKDAKLGASINALKYVNAAEILRYTGAGWTQAGISNFCGMMTNVFYIWCITNDPNSASISYGDGNWGISSLKALMAMGIFLERPDIFNNAVYQSKSNSCCSVMSYVLPSGEIGETGRDQGHAQLGFGQLAECSEMAWKQGVDLYSYGGSRLLAAFEYSAKYNLGGDVPYVTFGTCNATYGSISSIGRGDLRPIYEMAWNHYVNRALIPLPAPDTKRGVDWNFPEGAAFKSDHVGFGTLLWSLVPWSPTLSLPSPWLSQSIGTVTPGSGNFTNGAFIIKASANDISGTVDSFQFVYLPVTNDCEVIARVKQVTSSASVAGAKSGVMIRETLTTGSRHVSMFVTYGSGVTYSRRTTTSASASTTTTNGLSDPYWVRVKRTGNVFVGYYSPDGSTWSALGTNTISTMATNVYVGLPFTSTTPGVNGLGLVDHVTVIGGGVPAAPPTPTILTATAISASQINLIWPASVGALSYNIKRSPVTGGPYLTVASVTGTNSSDVGLASGTTYYYTVSAVNSVAESTNSIEAAATTSAGVPLTLIQDSFTTASASVTGRTPQESTIEGRVYQKVATDSSYATSVSGGVANMGAQVGEVISLANGVSYTKPAEFKMEATFNVGTASNNVPPFVGRGVFFGFWQAIPSTGSAFASMQGVFVNPDSGQLVLWNGDNSISATPVQTFPYNGTWIGGSQSHTLSYTINTASGGIYNFALDGVAYNWTPTTIFSDLNTAYAGFGVSAAANGQTGHIDSFKVSTVTQNLTPPQLGFGVSGNQLQLSWPSDHLGWRLQSQTNTLGAGLGTNWFTVFGSTTTNQIAMPVGLNNGSVFFRLNYP